MPACVRNSANLITTLLPSLPLFCIVAVAPQIFASYEKRRAALVWIEFFFSFFQRGKPDSKQKYLQVHFVEYSSINFTCTCLKGKLFFYSFHSFSFSSSFHFSFFFNKYDFIKYTSFTYLFRRIFVLWPTLFGTVDRISFTLLPFTLFSGLLIFV